MKTSTLYKLFILFSFVALLPFSEAKAQDEPSEDECLYTTSCFSIGYENLLETADSDSLLLVLNVIRFGPCEDVQQLQFFPTGGKPSTLNLNSIDGNAFVELRVDSSGFSAQRLVNIVTFNSTGGIVNQIQMTINPEAEDGECSVTLLPVELISFEGSTTNNNIKLNWSTASEQDNKQFEIERSADGLNFSQIGIVEGSGNSSVRLDYSFTDSNPLNGVNYYRLKQVDFAGTYDYSNVIAIDYAGTSISKVAQAVVAPNPCRNGDCTVTINNAGMAKEINVQLKDLSGRVVFSKTVQHQGEQVNLALDELKNHKGLYILTTTSGGNVMHQRVVLE